MNRLQCLLITTLSLTLSGVAFAANADAFSPSQCAPFVNASEVQILQQSVSQETVNLADQCVQNNVCSQLYSDPSSISICAKKLNTADYLVNFSFTRDYLNENQPIGQGQASGGYSNWTNSDNSTQTSNSASSNTPKFTASSPASSSSSDTITPVNLNDDNNSTNTNNNIHWF